MGVLSVITLAFVATAVCGGDIDKRMLIDVMSEVPVMIKPFNQGCAIAINGRGVLPHPQPLFIVPGTSEFLHPETRNGVINMDHQQQVELFCSGSGFAAPFNGAVTLLATCLSGQAFSVNGRRFELNRLRCHEQVKHVARRSDRTTVRNICPSNVTQIEIGFQIPHRFLWVMDVCHDEVLESTNFVYAKMRSNANGFQRSIVRPPFTGGIFFNGRNVDAMFTGFRQRQTMAGIIGQDRVDKLWDDDRDFFFARGHLAARSDFIWESEQRASFYLVNAAPQWHSFNAGNWQRIEGAIQTFLTRRNINADVYTGTFGIQELADGSGVQRPLFLSFNSRGRGRIPVPKFYYKIVIGQRSRRGIAFVGVNNPHATQEDIRSGRYHLCRDISDRVNWVDWVRADLTMGYSYACEVNELASVVGHLPNSVNAVGLLV